VWTVGKDKSCVMVPSRERHAVWDVDGEVPRVLIDRLSAGDSPPASQTAGERVMRMSISERTTPRRPQRAERPKPIYIARAKVGNGWVTIGAYWRLRSGDDGFSVKLNTLPLG